MSWRSRSCPVCAGGGWGEPSADASITILLSTVGGDSRLRKQKSSGSLVMCAACLTKILDGKPLPKKLRDGLELAAVAIGIELQRALPLKATRRR